MAMHLPPKKQHEGSAQLVLAGSLCFPSFFWGGITSGFAMNGTHLEASQMKVCGASFQVPKGGCSKTHPKMDIDLQGNDDHISPSPFRIFKGMSFPRKDMDSFFWRVFSKSLVTSPIGSIFSNIYLQKTIAIEINHPWIGKYTSSSHESYGSWVMGFPDVVNLPMFCSQPALVIGQ